MSVESRASEVIEYETVDTWLGRALVASTPVGIRALLLGESDADLLADLRRRFPAATLVEAAGRDRRPPLDELLDAPRTARLAPALDLRGTEFQLRVWQALREIPRGTTATYAQIAEKIGAPTSTRAVAGACGANHVAVLVPCHRVVRSDGSLSGYRWGVERKRALLAREGVLTPDV